MKPPASQEKNK